MYANKVGYWYTTVSCAVFISFVIHGTMFDFLDCLCTSYPLHMQHWSLCHKCCMLY